MSQSRRLASSDARPTIARPGGSPPPASTRSYDEGESVAGKYRLLEMLGEGGMGTVWRARNETLDVDVALKLLRCEGDDQDAFVDGVRLLQEARAAAQLGHPAIARVYDYGTCERGHAFLVMELLEGEDLAHALARRGRLSPTKAVATLLPIVHALSVTHQKGIVHRDIKTDNIFLARGEDRRMQPKLLDFGIAKVERPQNPRLTRTGAMLGSPLYMSPEQARGEEVDHLSDIWSLCVVLYEMIAGSTPFASTTYNGLLYAIVATEPPALWSLGFGDRRLWEIIERGLAKDRQQRWPSMRDLGMELASWLLTQGQTEDIAGGSLHQQWFRRVGSKTDLLASFIPPPDESVVTIREPFSLRLSKPPRLSDIDVKVSLESLPDEPSFTGGVVSVPATTVRSRFVALALGSATLGALIVLSALWLSRGGVSAQPEGGPALASELAASVHEGEGPAADDALEDPQCLTAASPETATEVAARKSAAPPQRQRSRRSRLKNPFE